MLGAKPPSSPTLVAEKSEKKTTEIKDLNCYITVTQTPINHKLTLFQVVPLCTGVVTKING